MGWKAYVDESNVAGASAGRAECLVKAFNERAIFAGMPPASLITERPLISAMNSNFCSMFDSALNSLIPYYGRIVSGEYVAYTTSSIYTEMTETRITTTRQNRFPRLWFEQVIRVINKLLMTNDYSFTPQENFLSTWAGWSAAPGTSTGATIEQAVDNAISVAGANIATGIVWTTPYQMLHITTLDTFTAPFRATAGSSNKILTLKTTRTDFFNTNKKISVVLYAGNLNGENYGFNGGDAGFTFGYNLIFDKIECVVGTDGTVTGLPPIPGESLTNFPKYPSPDNDNRTYGYRGGIQYFLITGVFEFIAGS